MEKLRYTLTFRVSASELREIEGFREELQREAAPGAIVTQRQLMLTAIQQYRKYYASLIADRKRTR